MKKYTTNSLIASAVAAVVWCPLAASANDLLVSGYLQFDADYGTNYDSHIFPDYEDQVTNLDFAVEGRLNFDYAASTKAGLEYGMHMELDLFQSDGETYDDYYYQLGGGLFPVDDVKSGDGVTFNDGYVFINSALGNIKLGDTGAAGLAKNQLNVPVLPIGALAYDDYNEFDFDYWIYPPVIFTEGEMIHYSNSFAGIDFEASIDDDGIWALGAGYTAAMGGVDVKLGMSAARSTIQNLDIAQLAGSIEAQAGGLTAGISLASMDIDKLFTDEYVAAGVSYQAGALTVGLGVENRIVHFAASPSPGGEIYVTNYFAGAEYELADGLLIGAGIGSLDGDNIYNWEPIGAYASGVTALPRLSVSC